jgi:hypothetical protein
MAGGPFKTFSLHRPGLGDSTLDDVAGLINPSWLPTALDLGNPTSDPAPTQPLSVVSPPASDPFNQTFTLDPSGNMIQASPGLTNPFSSTYNPNTVPATPAAKKPNWLLIGGGALAAILLVSASSGRR